MYIEFVIADNFLLTYLAGAAGYRLCHNRVCVWRTVIAALVGTTIAVFYPFFDCAAWILFVIKLGLWCVLSAIMYYKTPRCGVAAMLFLGSTFALGGASYAALTCFSGGAADFVTKYPICLVLGVGCAVYGCMRYAVRRLRLVRARAPYEYRAEVTVFGTRMVFCAFLDTGNCVFDGKTGLPVVITDIGVFTDKLSGGAAVRFAKDLPKLRQMQAKTPAGSTEIYIVQPTEITVYSDRHKHKINAMIGLIGSAGRFTAAHEMLLCPAAMTEVV